MKNIKGLSDSHILTLKSRGWGYLTISETIGADEHKFKGSGHTNEGARQIET